MKDTSTTNCKTCQLSFKKKRADNCFCSKACRDRDSYQNNRTKAIKAATDRIKCPKKRKSHNKSQLKWAHSNFEKRKNADLKRKYDISLEDYKTMMESQDGKCAICTKKHDSLHVDHDHSTGKIRGLLCQTCNMALGLMKDNITSLLKAVEYLSEKSQEES